MPRLFTAVKIPASGPILSAYNELREQLKDSRISWVKPEKLHITLHFLGDTPEFYLNSLQLIISKHTIQQRRFDLEMRSLGFFGSVDRPKILWMGCRETEIMEQIQQNLNIEFTELGFKLDERKFSPHLTLGRVKQLQKNSLLEELVKDYTDKLLDSVSVNEIILFRSDLTKSGPIYTPVLTFPLI